jgi:CheY-like chemotaxis protein
VKSLADKKLKALVANDEAMQLYVLQVMLLKFDFEVITAINGHEAYEIVAKSINCQEWDIENQYEKMFDLIILDLNMPISDGFTSCQNILKLYTKDSLFKHDQKSSKMVIPINDLSLSQSLIASNKVSAFSCIQLKDLKPYMIACSSEMRDYQLQLKLDKAGFDNMYSVPLKSE